MVMSVITVHYVQRDIVVALPHEASRPLLRPEFVFQAWDIVWSELRPRPEMF